MEATPCADASLCGLDSSFKVGRCHAGLFPIAARFNHACRPNNNIEYRYDDGLVLSVRVDHIEEGNELFITYAEDKSPATLFAQYGFVCECGACEGLSREEVAELTSTFKIRRQVYTGQGKAPLPPSPVSLGGSRGRPKTKAGRAQLRRRDRVGRKGKRCVFINAM